MSTAKKPAGKGPGNHPRPEIIDIALDMLVLNKKHPREHSRQQIRQIERSIDQFGFIGVVIIDAEYNVICGHARIQAARNLDMASVPAIMVTHLSKAELQTYMLADNKLTENAKWNDQLLGELMFDLSHLNLDFDLDITGFSMGEIDLLIEGVTAPADDKADALPEAPAGPAVTQMGDLWLLGSHRLLCGDATLAESYVVLMKNERAQVVFTDPPYNVKIDGHVSGLGATKHREFAMATGEMSEVEFEGFLRQVFRRLTDSSEDGSIHYVCMDWRHMQELLAAGDELYTELKNICVWVKDNGGMGTLYRSRHEMVAVFKNGKAPHINNVELGKHGRNRTNVWEYPCANTFSKSSDEGRLIELHPTVKPVKLVADALLDTSRRGSIVLDPFLGSGTTLMAAERIGRVAYGLELDPLYCDLIIRRWQAWTGEDAVHVETGKTFNQILKAKEGDHA